MSKKQDLEKTRPSVYTDLALETAESAGGGANSEIDGVRTAVSDIKIHGGDLKITDIEIYNENGAKSLCRPIGSYITLESGAMKSNDILAHEDIIKILAERLTALKAVKDAKSILVVGLGNWNVTPDALGPRVVSKVLVTRHITSELPENLDHKVLSVAAVSPGVMGITGIETGEIVSGIVEKIKPGAVIAIDALAARRVGRVNSTIQLSDTGLTPGSGMGNARAALNSETLGIPVIAIGVPTVVDAATLVNDTMELMLDDMAAELPEGSEFFDMLSKLRDEEKYEIIRQILDPYECNMFVTPKDVDAVIDRLSNIIANAVNIALHPGITKEDINRYMY